MWWRKRSNVVQKGFEGLYIDRSLAKISWSRGSTRNDVTLLSLKWREVVGMRFRLVVEGNLRTFIGENLGSTKRTSRLFLPWSDVTSSCKEGVTKISCLTKLNLWDFSGRFWHLQRQLLGQLFWRIWFPSTFHFEVLVKSKIPCRIYPCIKILYDT